MSIATSRGSKCSVLPSLSPRSSAVQLWWMTLSSTILDVSALQRDSSLIPLLSAYGVLGFNSHLFKDFKNYHTEERQDLFLIIPECKTCDNGLKL